MGFLISESKVKVGKRDIFFVLRNPCLDETILQPDTEPRGSEQNRDEEGGGLSPVSSGLVEVTAPIWTYTVKSPSFVDGHW